MTVPRTIHGLDIVVPSAWTDHTVYRFALPAADELKVPLQAKSRPHQAFRSNVVVAKIRLAGPFSAETLFEKSNQQQAAADPTYKVLNSGSARLGSKESIWQDATLTISNPRIQLFQRQVATRLSDSDAVVVTLTSDRSDLEKPFAEMRLQLVEGA